MFSEYLLGEDILVAPILEKGSTARDIVLPSGAWIDGNNGTVYNGNQTLKSYPAPIDVLPYFLKEGSSVANYSSRINVMNIGLFVIMLVIVTSRFL